MKKLILLVLFVSTLSLGQTTMTLIKSGYYYYGYTDTVQISTALSTSTYDTCQLILFSSDSIKAGVLVYASDNSLTRFYVDSMTFTGTGNNGTMVTPSYTGYGNVLVGDAIPLTAPYYYFKIEPCRSGSATGNGLVDYSSSTKASYKLYARLKRKQ